MKSPAPEETPDFASTILTQSFTTLLSTPRRQRGSFPRDYYTAAFLKKIDYSDG